MIELLRRYCPALSDAQRARMAVYWEMLLDWNERINLTAVTEPAEAAQKHFADSLTALPYIPEGARCIDVGTGAGFPGIPLLIVRPDIRMTLLDGLRKRVRFLEAVCEELGLKADCVHARAEDAGRDKAHRERYDVALARAVAPLPTLLELTTPFIMHGGLSICYKGNAAEELRHAENALTVLRCAARAETVEAAWGRRTLVMVQKQGSTPSLYPRHAGLPEKKPL